MWMLALNGDVDRHAGVIWWRVHGRGRDPGHHNMEAEGRALGHGDNCWADRPLMLWLTRRALIGGQVPGPLGTTEA